MCDDGRYFLPDCVFSPYSFSAKSLAIRFSLYLCCAFLFAGCALPVGEDWREIAGGASAVVIDYNLQNYVPVPYTGGAPVWKVERGDVRAEVQWRDKDGKDLSKNAFTSFDKDATYNAVITLIPQTGYFFYSKDLHFTYPEWMVETQAPVRGEDGLQEVVTVAYRSASDTAAGPKEPEITIVLPFVPES
ncbi:MAG: hypothetical protein LBP81_08100 [Treponema sp.]|jgi:hypothetical protein|nr:hypothetical protein [Treponema sp.]